MKKNKLKAIAAILLMACANATSFAQIPEKYYDSLKGKKGAELKSAVHDIIKTANVLSYGSSGSRNTWWGFWQTDRTSDGRYIDRYSAEKDWVKSTSQGSVGSGLNIEHSFAKSWWGGSNNQAYKDLYNLMPCESKINSTKSNYPMGKVTGTDKGNGWTKVGDGDDGKKYWEPADEWKGDFARGYMYMATCYSNLTWEGTGLQILENGDYPTLKQWAYELYIQWAKADKPSQLEIERNNKVSEIQGNRNPFVDFPNLMEYIWGDSIDTPFNPATTVCSDKYSGDNTPVTPGEPTEGVIATYTFTSGAAGFNIESKNNPLTTEIWQQTSSYGWKATAYYNKTNNAADASIVSPEIDLTGYAEATLNFNHALNFIQTDTPEERLSVEVRCDGQTTTLSGITWPAGNSWAFNASGDIDLSQFAGKKIRIAFHYTSTSSIASTWEIKSATISGKKGTSGISHTGISADGSQPGEIYTLDGQKLKSAPEHGTYILRQGDKAVKIAK